MQRYTGKALQDMTTLPAIFDVLRHEDAEGTCYDVEAEGWQDVRRISRKEFNPHGRNLREQVKEYLPDRVFNELLGINILQVGLKKKDERIMDSAFRLLGSPPTRSFDPTWLWGGTPNEFSAHMLSKRSDFIEMTAVGWLAKFLKRARLSYWIRFKGNQMKVAPCIYCPNFATALAVNLVFHDKIRMCARPDCGQLFVAKRPDQPCCTPKCAAAYRTARCRERKKKSENR